MTYDQFLKSPDAPQGDAHPIPSVLVACEDPVLLRAVERVISWRRPDWVVDGVVGPESASRRLAEGTYQVVVVCMEVDSPAGVQTLRLARTLHPQVLRVAYSTAPCSDPEVTQSSEQVTGAAAVGCLVGALDRVMRSAPGLHSAVRQGQGQGAPASA